MATAKKSKNKEPIQSWNRITGTMKVYGNTFKDKRGKYTKWSATISGKASKDSEEWENYYLRVYFRGDDAQAPDTDGLHTIDINNAFFSLDIYEKDGEVVKIPVLIITDCEVTE